MKVTSLMTILVFSITSLCSAEEVHNSELRAIGASSVVSAIVTGKGLKDYVSSSHLENIELLTIQKGLDAETDALKIYQELIDSGYSERKLINFRKEFMKALVDSKGEDLLKIAQRFSTDIGESSKRTTLLMRYARKVYESELALNPSKSPEVINLKSKRMKGKGLISLGVGMAITVPALILVQGNDGSGPKVLTVDDELRNSKIDKENVIAQEQQENIDSRNK